MSISLSQQQRALLTTVTDQVPCHVHSDGCDLLAVLADHFLDDVGEVIVLRLPDDVQECLHHWLNVGGDVFFGLKGNEKKNK